MNEYLGNEAPPWQRSVTIPYLEDFRVLLCHTQFLLCSPLKLETFNGVICSEERAETLELRPQLWHRLKARSPFAACLQSLPFLIPACPLTANSPDLPLSSDNYPSSSCHRAFAWAFSLLLFVNSSFSSGLVTFSSDRHSLASPIVTKFFMTHSCGSRSFFREDCQAFL